MFLGDLEAYFGSIKGVWRPFLRFQRLFGHCWGFGGLCGAIRGFKGLFWVNFGLSFEPIQGERGFLTYPRGAEACPGTLFWDFIFFMVTIQWELAKY